VGLSARDPHTCPSSTSVLDRARAGSLCRATLLQRSFAQSPGILWIPFKSDSSLRAAWLPAFMGATARLEPALPRRDPSVLQFATNGFDHTPERCNLVLSKRLGLWYYGAHRILGRASWRQDDSLVVRSICAEVRGQ
jgi:hypothetical protein